MAYFRFRQICLAAPRLADVEPAMTALLGAPVCFRDQAVAKYGLENALWNLGDMFVEIVAPIAAGTTAQRFIERADNPLWGGYMAIFDCENPRERGAHAEKIGVKKIVDHTHAYPAGVYTGVQLHPRDCRAAMIEFNRTEGGGAHPEKYAPAGPDWTGWPKTQTRVDHIVLEGREDLGAHWAAIVQRPLEQNMLRFNEAKIVFKQGPREMMSEIALANAGADFLDRAKAHGLTIVEGAAQIAGVKLRAL
jgi:hypothetical protein